MIRKLRFLLTLTAMMSALALTTTGCELEDDADADGTTGTDTNPGDTADNDTTTVNPLDYMFVRLDDLSTNGDTPDSGADIDAIILDKASGATLYAENVEFYLHGGGAVTGDEIDPTESLGQPDSFFDYPNVTECGVEGGFVSLGGFGGQLIVKMGGAIENGDTLTVLEIGGCDRVPGTGQAAAEQVDVFVSVGSDVDGQWVGLGDGEGPTIPFTISNLPVVMPTN